MKAEFKRLAAVCLWAAMLGLPAHALFGEGEAAADAEGAGAETAAAEDADPKDIESKLLPLMTLEDAFLKAVRERNRLQRYILQESRKLEAATDDESKAEIRKNIGTARKAHQTRTVAMDVVFGIGRRRDYEYNQVTSTVYLRVGTVEEAFARAVQARDRLQEFVREQQAAKEAEADEEKKAEIQKSIDNAVRQYQLVAASLQLVFQVTPKRNYLYNPKNSTLYLKVTENEVEKLKEQAAKLQAEKAAKDAAAAGGE